MNRCSSCMHVRRCYDVGETRVVALDDISLTIGAGEFVAIVGPSGSGKSTLLQIVGLLDRPTEGTVTLDGRDLEGLSDAERTRLRLDTLGFVFQRFHLLNDLTALENVEVPMEAAGVPPAERYARAAALLRAVGPGRTDAFPSVAAVGRPAPARGHRPRPGEQPTHHPGRRADRRAAQRGQSPRHRAVPPAPRRGPGDRDGDPRHGGGRRGRAPDRDPRRARQRGRPVPTLPVGDRAEARDSGASCCRMAASPTATWSETGRSAAPHSEALALAAAVDRACASTTGPTLAAWLWWLRSCWRRPSRATCSSWAARRRRRRPRRPSRGRRQARRPRRDPAGQRGGRPSARERRRDQSIG